MPKFGVKNPVTTLMIFLAIIVLGGFAYTRIGIDLMPDMDIPVLSVITSYRGAGPQEVESRITEAVESMVSSVENVDEVTSISAEGVSIVTVKFNWGTDMNEASNDIRDKLEIVKRMLPDAAETPLLFKIDPSAFPVLIYGVSATDSWKNLEKIIEEGITEKLKRVDGVASVLAMGGDTRKISVYLDKERMAATGITGHEIVAALRAQNLMNPGGNIKSDSIDYLLRVPELFTSVDQIGEVVLRSTSNGIIRVKDVAQIVDGPGERSEESFINGKKIYALIVQKQSGGNTVAVANAVKKAMPGIIKDLPKDVSVNEFMDSSIYIQNSIDNLKESLILGGITVLLVILFFIKDFKASLIIATSIPTSLIITFLLMYLNDYTINQLSLSSLVIAIGMVVDNSIVVIDNIKRYIDRGVRPKEAAVWGAGEMNASVMASSLTTVAVFIPILFATGLTKIIFGQLAIIVSMALLASIISALLLVPTLSAKFLKGNTPDEVRELQEKEKHSWLSKLEDAYVSFLDLTLKNRGITVAIIFGLGFLSLFLFKVVGTEFMPEQDQGRFSINIELPTGTRYEETGKICTHAAKIVEKLVPEAQQIMLSYGSDTENATSMLFNQSKASNTGTINVKLHSKDTRAQYSADKRFHSIKDIIARVRPEIEAIPGMEARFSASSGGMSMGGSANFTLNIYGHDLEKGVEYSEEIVSRLKNNPHFHDLEISQKLARPEIVVRVDREKASSLGINVSSIASLVELYYSGDSTVKYREGGDEYDILVKLRPEDRQSIKGLGSIYIQTPTGEQMPLSNLATISEAKGPTKINRSEQTRYMQVTASVYGITPGQAVKEAETIINEIPAPSGFTWEFGGDEKERVDAFILLAQATIIGILLVYMVMASQFESFLAPFIIALSLPFGFSGSILAIYLSGQTLSVLTFIGLIILVGIVVNNGIVLISYVNMLIERGYNSKNALLAGARNRFRPILATTITTVVGMLPMAISTGDGAEVWQPIGWSVVGGLIVSTLMTLLLMPTLYSLFQKWLVPEEQRM